MKREIITTKDGSKTIFIPQWNEQYHSIHGAIQEAYHVFLQMGFFYCLSLPNCKQLHILEVGFGTGLNALITLKEAKSNSIPVHYTAIEAFPVIDDEINQLNYPELLKIPNSVFKSLHTASWEKEIRLNDTFTILKKQQKFEDITASNAFQLIYFDAFGARVQPELWTETIFTKMYQALKPNGVLVTYSAKGSVRRAMQAVGFRVEKLPGPSGKREMLRGIKPPEQFGFNAILSFLAF